MVVVQRRQRSVQKSVMRMQSSIVFFVAVVVVVVAAELPLEPFLSRDQPLCKLIGTKERFYIRKRFNPHRTGLEHGRRYVENAEKSAVENAVLGKNGDNSGIISFELTLSKHKISTVANEELNGQILF